MDIVILISLCGVLALIAAAAFAQKVLAIKIDGTAEEVKRFNFISGAIQKGAMAFLSKEYFYVSAFVIVFAVIIGFSLDHTSTDTVNEGWLTAFSFVTGAVISSISAFLGMRIATKGNVRTTIRARISLTEAFRVAFNSGSVMGFALAGLAVLGLLLISLFFLNIVEDPYLAMEIAAGFGLGGSTVALFGRVGGGIYTKAADVGADLVGKVEAGIPEDDPRNPAVIADNVGDNVGDIAGMGADLFGSCAEATCAALVIGATAAAIIDGGMSSLLFPILVSAVGIPICLVTSLFARVKPDATSVEPVLKNQLLISTILMAIAMYFITKSFMVESFVLGDKLVTNDGVLYSLLSGLISGLMIGYITEYYT
ncbi:MAG: sodium/proton-translocating pyrophosphatase, partial [Oligoflexales bacterium]|nr:sodium/proton-translocating pyrophosphatase [Oligoflexales bacterium]